MSRNSGILGAAADAVAGWNDETRVAFDKRYIENMERKIEAFEAALAALQKAAEEVNNAIQNLDIN